MKYLSNYNYFNESLNSEKIEWLKDALIELEDDGYNVNIRTHSVWGVSEPGITITIDGKILPIDIGDYLLTIHSYLSEKGYCGFNAYDYDNESQSRHEVRVRASLGGIDNNFERDLPNFVDMLTRFTGKAPFDSVSVSYYKPNSNSNSNVNESYDIYNTISDCKDILLDLTDVGIRCGVDAGIKWDGVRSGINVDKVKIEIVASSLSKVRLGDFSLSFEHLISYLESKGYILDSKGSFYENDDWDYYEGCPTCGSNNVSFVDRCDGQKEYLNDDRNINDWKCGKCGKVGEQEDFLKPEHPISKSELLNSIRNNYYIDFMYLIFRKK